MTGVHTMDDNILRFRFSKNRQKWPFLGAFEPPRTDSTLMIEDWRHWRLSVARSPWLVERLILFISYWESPLFCIFQLLLNTTQRKCQLMHYTRYRNSVFAKFTVFVGSLLSIVSHKMNSCAVLLERFKSFQTLIHKRRTLGEPFDVTQT